MNRLRSIQWGWNEERVSFDVLILGAGMAGLTAARALAERGLRVCVLEGQDRVGGRILSQTVQGGNVVELGAEFIHGHTAELWALIAEAGVETVERDGTMLREGWGGRLEVDDAEDESMFAPLKALEGFDGEDMAFWDWLKGSDVPKLERQAVLGYVEGFNAADARRIGVKSLGAQQRAEDASEGDRAWRVVGGYAQLTEYLARRIVELGGEIRLSTEVLGVRWREGEACAETAQGDVTGRRCIVTLPLGVLQRVNKERGVFLEPEPAAIEQARRLAMGDAVRFTMTFRERWWERSGFLEKDALERMSFLLTPERMPPVWWTDHPSEQVRSPGSGTPYADTENLSTLTGWIGGPRAKSMRGKTAEEMGDAACVVLAEVFGLGAEGIRQALVSTEMHDWAGDPWSLGAYSYVPAGAMDAPKAMTVPEEGTMFFAGEHTDVTGHWGTVHAALRSGLRAAGQVLGEDEGGRDDDAPRTDEDVPLALS
jgi:monoamine oxidase